MAVGHNQLEATAPEIRDTLRAFTRYTEECWANTPAGLSENDIALTIGLRDGLNGTAPQTGPTYNVYMIGYRAALALRKGGTPWL